MQNASWGVRTFIACQFRFSTRTVAFVNTLLMQVFAQCHGAEAFVLCWWGDFIRRRLSPRPGRISRVQGKRMRPYVICHMCTTIDGKILGDRWGKLPSHEDSATLFETTAALPGYATAWPDIKTPD